MSSLFDNENWLARRRKLIAKGKQMGGTRVSDMGKYKPKKEIEFTSLECEGCGKPITQKEIDEAKVISLNNGKWIHEDCV